MSKIFIQIASYRDPELISTIDDCISKAKYPENLKFCIAWQHDTNETLDKYKNNSRVEIIDIPYKESKGACWARNLIQQRYDNEEYTLQLDSHHRFIENWDERCIDTLKQLQQQGFAKPLITTYAPSYDPDNDPGARTQVPWQMNFDRFIPEGAIFFLPAAIENYKQITSPIPARFYSAHFCFTLGQFCKEVPHDPSYYFHGEEISIAVRAFTWGYDLFHPNEILVWHEYTRKNRTKHWDDDRDWYLKNAQCHSRNRKLFKMDNEEQDIEFGVYGFGSVRTLEDYEKYAGVSFKRRAVQRHTIAHKIPPNPSYKTTEEYENSFLNIFKHCISVNKSLLNEPDYNYWAVIFEDREGNCLNRKDIDSSEIARLLQTINGSEVNIWREFDTDIKPHKWIIWPSTFSKGWVSKIEQQM